ncbi:MAG TPA: hypothetical protein VMF89_16630, partial [Polyangiales bacterium]|nr:hypothetical protein [Polyangiales bacterium]
MRSALVLAGYLYDYRLAFRYGKETLALLYEVSGFALAARLGRYLGKRVAFLVGMLTATLRRVVSPNALRGPPALVALRYFVRSAMGMLGVSATSLDGVGAGEILRMLEPLAGAPSVTSGRMIYLSCRALALGLLGREADHRHAMVDALREVRSGRRRDMSEFEYRALLAGLLMSDGLNETTRENSKALEQADTIESLGTAIAYIGALRIRSIYYARRGDAARAEHYRNLLGLQAIQGGTVWQGEWFSVPNEGAAAASWSDLVVLRRSLDRMRLLAAEVPPLARIYEGMRVTYHFRRGEYERGAELGAQYVANHPPRTLTGWSSCYGVVALCYVEIGQAQKARALCEHALAQVSNEDLSYFVLYTPLEVAYATAIAMTGEPERGKALMQQKIERIREHGEHSTLVIVYQYQARMARLLGDRELLAQSLQAMREAALMSGLPAVILLATRVAELQTGNRSSPLPPPSAPLDS